MAEDTVPTFTAFARDNGLKPRGACAVCELPPEVRAELATAREQGFGAKAMCDYLAAIGIGEVTNSSVNNHLVRRHPW